MANVPSVVFLVHAQVTQSSYWGHPSANPEVAVWVLDPIEAWWVEANLSLVRVLASTVRVFGRVSIFRL